MSAAPKFAEARAAKLPLPNLKVRWFRGIEKLDLPRLARVSLIVGLNGAGKSTLLEAARIIASAGDPRVLMDLVQRREGVSPAVWRSDDVEEIGAALSHLFLGFKRWTNLIEVSAEEGRYASLRIMRTHRIVERTSEMHLFGASEENVLQVEIGNRTPVEVPFEQLGKIARWGTPEALGPAVLVGAEGLSRPQIGTMWDAIALTELEEVVLSALRNVVPRVQRISLVADRRSPNVRHVMVRLDDSSAPQPLGLLGGGAVRLFGLALALANARGGILLLDEVENGLHYEVQDQIWTLIFDLAERFDVQVLATTHSWDSIIGFQFAANRSTTEGILYRLDRSESGEVHAVRYSERDLAIAAEQRIEVR